MKSALQGDGREVVENQTKLVISCMRGIVTRARESKISRTSQMEAPLVIETQIQCEIDREGRISETAKCFKCQV